MFYTQNCACKDPRDRIYGLLSMLPAGVAKTIGKADYTKSVFEVRTIGFLDPLLPNLETILLDLLYSLHVQLLFSLFPLLSEHAKEVLSVDLIPTDSRELLLFTSLLRYNRRCRC
jgi:hypothetical protein